MKAPNLLARLRQSRRTSLIVFAISLFALVATATWFISARSALADAYGRLGNAKQALSEAQVREQEAQLKVEQARSASDLVLAATAANLQPSGWGERLISLQQAQLTRSDAATLLGALGRSNGRITGTEAFELSVTHPDEGLFDVPNTLDRIPAPLSVTIRGSVMFRTSEFDPTASAATTAAGTDAALSPADTTTVSGAAP
jgi:hypothetical protein